MYICRELNKCTRQSSLALILIGYVSVSPVFGHTTNEMEACPDLSEHQSTLDDGIKARDGVSVPSSEGSHSRVEIIDSMWSMPKPYEDEGRYVYADSAIVRKSEDEALQLEKDGKLVESLDALKQILAMKRNEKIPNSGSIGLTLDDMARLNIKIGTPALPTSKHWRLKRGHPEVANWESPGINEYIMGRDQLIDHTASNYIAKMEAVLDQPKRTKIPAWDEALILAEEARSDRNRHPLLTGEITYALLLEWKGRYVEAASVILKQLEAAPDDNLAVWAATQFCGRHLDKEVGRLVEKTADSHKSPELAALFEVYRQTGRKDDALRVFKIMLWGSNGKFKVPVSSILPMLHDVNDSEQNLFNDFIGKGIFEFSAADVSVLLDGFYERGWTELPKNLYNSIVRPVVPSLETVEVLQVFGDYFIKKNQYPEARFVEQDILGYAQSAPASEPQLKAMVAKEVAAKMTQPWCSDPESKKLRELADTKVIEFTEEYQRLQCLTMAARLDSVAFDLEKRDLNQKAEKLYAEALQIRVANLGPAAPDTVTTYGNLARVKSAIGDFDGSAKLYEKALQPYRRNPSTQDRSYATLLESYAQMLAASKQQSKSDHVYDEARAFYKKRADIAQPALQR